MKTSTRISIQFTALATALVLLFALLVNIFSFQSWHNRETKALRAEANLFLQKKVPRPGPANKLQFTRTIIIPAANLDMDSFEEHRLPWVVHLNNDAGDTLEDDGVKEDGEKRLLLREMRWDNIAIMDITSIMQRQIALIRLSILVLLLTGLISYLASRRFVKRALRDVYSIADFAQSIDVDKLENNLHFDHLPETDEINTIALSLNQMTSKLHDQVNQIKRFVSNVSHEFKTPLMVMRSQAELSQKAKTYKKWLSTSIAHIDQLNRLTDALLQLHGAQSNQPLPTEHINVIPLIRQSIEQTAAQYVEKHISIIDDIPDELTIDTDRGSLEIILRNLLDNAYKYTPEWGAITLTADEIHISVSDNGPGIDPELHNSIREPFWQADSSKWQDQWHGLWLALVKSLVDSLWWKISLESDHKQWSHFTLSFTT